MIQAWHLVHILFEYQDGGSKIQNVCQIFVFFLYYFNCIDVKSHKYIKVRYKVRYCGYFGTICMPISITVFEIQHIGTCTDLGEKFVTCLLLIKCGMMKRF